MQLTSIPLNFPIAVVLDNIRSGHNVGSIFRSCDGMGVQQLILGGISCAPPHKEIDKTALGATESVSWTHVREVPPALNKLKAQGFRIVGCETTPEAKPIQMLTTNPQQKIALVFGHEVRGISQEVLALCDECYALPLWGIKDSYNVAVAVGMALWHLRSQHTAYCAKTKQP